MNDLDLIERLERVKQHLMAHDGWSQADVNTINEAIITLDRGSWSNQVKRSD